MVIRLNETENCLDASIDGRVRDIEREIVAKRKQKLTRSPKLLEMRFRPEKYFFVKNYFGQNTRNWFSTRKVIFTIRGRPSGSSMLLPA